MLISSARSLLFDFEQAVQVDSNCGCGPMSIKEIIPKIAPKGDENAILSMMACLTDGERDVRETCAANEPKAKRFMQESFHMRSMLVIVP